MTGTWSRSTNLDDLHWIFVKYINKEEYKFFEWLKENDIPHFKWCYYTSGMKFGFFNAEDKVKFVLRWA